MELIDDSIEGVRSLGPHVRKYVPRTLLAIEERDSGFFARLGRLGESWRLYSEFAEDCVYLDIETTGLSPQYDEITVVGTFDGSEYREFVKGKNLHQLGHELKKYAVAITFNGSSFDLPFLRRKFAPSLPSAHIDLRWATFKLGYHGGLKQIESKFGVKRPKRVANIDGLDAVRLWNQYCRGDRYALERLIDYNRADVVGLRTIMEQCYSRSVAQQARFLPKARRLSLH
jgi:uncharacterized protein YprB with RNaseH-like and TPR domain